MAATPTSKDLGVDGRWVLYALLSGAAVPEELGKTFFAQLAKKRISLLATTLRTRPRPFKKQLVERFSKEVLPRLGGTGVGSAAAFEHVIDRTFHSLAEAQEAHDYMESNGNEGKIVLLLDGQP